ncbi:DUF2058 family protein [Cognatiluteimonas lumbrici]|uniref:DUF2058 family protein n=1 Tax=Cognatiluteimonas lumbrici TaxID=2559601 RepID=UPI001127BEB1|nr:DUF2058 family protein [Luteimonas lumbrici]
MSDSLRDQLLGLGFKPQPKPVRKPERKGERKPPRAAAKAAPRPPRKPTPQGDIDLAKAYAIRAQKEKEERIEAERRKQEAARERREARAKLAAFLQGKALNDAQAEIARHFEYGGKIKRIHVTEAQLKALNAGELGVVQLDGRYLLVDVATLDEAAAIFPACVALRVDPDAPVEDDIPPDLVW